MNNMSAIVLADTTAMSREHWLEERKRGIGGSEAGTIINVDSYKTKRGLWLEKTGKIEPEPAGEPAEVGILMEPVIDILFQRRTGIKTAEYKVLLQHREYPWMLANLDRVIPGERIGAEYKNVSLRKANEWEGDEIPDKHYAQCQHYMAVTGYEKWYIAALINGNHLVNKLIPRNDQFIDFLIEEEYAFWNCVETDTMPDGAFSKDLLKLLYPETNGAIITLPEISTEYSEQFKIAKANEKEAKLEAERFQVALCGMLGEAYKGLTPDGLFELTWSQVNPKPKFNEERFAVEQPDIFQKYLEAAKPYRKFACKKLKGE